MREAYAQAIYVLGCVMPWCVSRGALLIECSEQHAVSMPSLGVNVVPIRAPILMLAQTRKNKKETSRRTNSARSHMQQLRVAACMLPATCALAWRFAGVNSIPLGRTWTTLLQQCVAACMLPATCVLAWGFAYARLESEHISHRTQSCEQQSGRCRRHSSRRSCEGNGFDVWPVVVQSMRWLLPRMSRLTVV